MGRCQDPLSTDASPAPAHLCPSSITPLPGSLPALGVTAPASPPSPTRAWPLWPGWPQAHRFSLNPPVPAGAPEQPLLSDSRIGARGTIKSPKSLCAHQPHPGCHEQLPPGAPLGRSRSPPLLQHGIRARPRLALARSGHSDRARGRGDMGHGPSGLELSKKTQQPLVLFISLPHSRRTTL